MVKKSATLQQTTDPNFTQSEDALDSFAPRILAWFDHSGRHDLPWQQHKLDTPDPYPVWLSEVMLQQTQVATVIPYFHRFMTSFPKVQDLAKADWAQVAEHWAGLGYYARARNLHKGAKQLVGIIEQTGDFPQTVADWEQIAGVGLSTAGAIVAMGVRGYGVICDGNVKRVLTRHAGIKGDITKSATDRELWELATRLTPHSDSGRYAQAMMDMGATLCTRTRPKCDICPIASDCTAYQAGNPAAYPVKAKKGDKPSRHSVVLILSYDDKLLWLKRQRTTGGSIWHGFWCLPLLNSEQEISPSLNQAHLAGLLNKDDDTVQLVERAIYPILEKLDKPNLHALPTFKHTLTHFHWHLTPLIISLDKGQFEQIGQALADCQQDYLWQDRQTLNLALPKAMDKVLDLI